MKFVGIEATEAAARAFEETSPLARIVRSALPIGVTASDAIVRAAHEMSGRVVPGRIAEQRRRAVEALMSQADLLYGKRAMVMSAVMGLWLPRQMTTTALTAPSLTVLTVPLIWLRAEILS